MRESARIFDVRMAQFVLIIEKLSHIIVARGSQDLRSPSPIMAPGFKLILLINTINREDISFSFAPGTKSLGESIISSRPSNGKGKKHLEEDRLLTKCYSRDIFFTLIIFNQIYACTND